MRLIQPYPIHTSSLVVPENQRVACHWPVRFVKYRYPHHAAPSGHDRLCDFVNSPTVKLPKSIYWLGETILRPLGMLEARLGGKYEYSRYDFTMELATALDLFQHRDSVYHFIYAEKSFNLLERLAGVRGNRFIGTVHHPPEQQVQLLRNHNHFRVFTYLITMDERSVPFWKSVTGKENVSWIPYGVDTGFFVPLPIVSESTKKRILFAGSHLRDFDSLAKVVERTIKIAPQIQFDLIGSSPVIQMLAEHFEQVYQHVRISDLQYRELLQQADVLFLPLLMSTVCTAVLEAFACGTPVITTRGGIESYLNLGCAIAVEVGDVDRMVDALVGQISGADHNHLSREIARNTAEQFSWTKIAAKHVEFYQSLFSN